MEHPNENHETMLEAISAATDNFLQNRVGNEKTLSFIEKRLTDLINTGRPLCFRQ